MPLSMMKEGARVRVLRVTGDDATRKHLGVLGFVAGAVIAVVSVVDENMILAVHDSRVAVNGDISRHVIVEAV